MISLLDRCVAHEPFRFFQCDRVNLNHEKILMTDNFVFYEVQNKHKFCWLIEPETLIRNEYQYVISNSNKFNKIFTHSKLMLENSINSVFIPYGTTFLSENEFKLYKKTKLISIISSNKNFLPGHNFRLKVVQKLKEMKFIDIFGRGFNEIERKCLGLADYCYSVAMENSKYDFYFTEKLIDCFLSGTIPIYYGCPSIYKFFNMNGVYHMNSIYDLDDIISKISVEDYYSRIDAVKDNFERSLEYIDPFTKVCTAIENYK